MDVGHHGGQLVAESRIPAGQEQRVDQRRAPSVRRELVVSEGELPPLLDLVVRWDHSTSSPIAAVLILWVQSSCATTASASCDFAAASVTSSTG